MHQGNNKLVNVINLLLTKGTIIKEEQKIRENESVVLVQVNETDKGSRNNIQVYVMLLH